MWFSRLRHRRLAARREALRLRSTLLRERLAVGAAEWQAPLSLADSALDGLRWLRSHPEWPLGAALALVVLRPRLLLRWAGRGFWAWQLWRRARPHVRTLRRWWDGVPRRA
jgi:hypothetical protein